MNVSFTKKQEEYISAQLETGDYQNASEVVRDAKDRMDGIPDGGGRYDDLNATAYQEMSAANFEPASWAKAFAHASGDNEKAKSLYIKYRVEQLKHS